MATQSSSNKMCSLKQSALLTLGHKAHEDKQVQ